MNPQEVAFLILIGVLLGAGLVAGGVWIGAGLTARRDVRDMLARQPAPPYFDAWADGPDLVEEDAT